MAQGQTKNSKFGADNTDGSSLHHHQQQQQQQQQLHGMDLSMDNRSMLAGHFGHQQPHMLNEQQQQQQQPQHAVETNFDVDGNVETETKSISSVKSAGSGGGQGDQAAMR